MLNFLGYQIDDITNKFSKFSEAANEAEKNILIDGVTNQMAQLNRVRFLNLIFSFLRITF